MPGRGRDRERGGDRRPREVAAAAAVAATAIITGANTAAAAASPRHCRRCGAFRSQRPAARIPRSRSPSRGRRASPPRGYNNYTARRRRCHRAPRRGRRARAGRARDALRRAANTQRAGGGAGEGRAARCTSTSSSRRGETPDVRRACPQRAGDRRARPRADDINRQRDARVRRCRTRPVIGAADEARQREGQGRRGGARAAAAARRSSGATRACCSPTSRRACGRASRRRRRGDVANSPPTPSSPRRRRRRCSHRWPRCCARASSSAPRPTATPSSRNCHRRRRTRAQRDGPRLPEGAGDDAAAAGGGWPATALLAPGHRTPAARRLHRVFAAPHGARPPRRRPRPRANRPVDGGVAANRHRRRAHAARACRPTSRCLPVGARPTRRRQSS